MVNTDDPDNLVEGGNGSSYYDPFVTFNSGMNDYASTVRTLTIDMTTPALDSGNFSVKVTIISANTGHTLYDNTM